MRVLSILIVSLNIFLVSCFVGNRALPRCGSGSRCFLSSNEKEIVFTMDNLSQGVNIVSEFDELDVKLPVTVLSGFLGAGKTTMLQHILKDATNGKRYAVIVNDMGELNIDEKLIGAHVTQKEEQIAKLSNGCICCSLREDLVREVAALARKGSFDHLVVESTGISEPLPVAETFLLDAETLAAGLEGAQVQVHASVDRGTAVSKRAKGEPPSPLESLVGVAELDTMVTIVDAVNFLADVAGAEDLSTRTQAAGDEDFRTLTELLVAQVEFADVIVVNKVDVLRAQLDGEEKLLRLKQHLRALNSEAHIVETEHSRVDIDLVIGARRFDMDAAQQRPSWIKAMNDPDHFNRQHHHQRNDEGGHTHASEIDTYGINSILYRRRRPFHPIRLMDFIDNYLGSEDGGGDERKKEEEAGVTPSTQDQDKIARIKPQVVRSKGFFWLASRPEEQMMWSQAGSLFQLTPSGMWWADTLRSEWPTNGPDLEQIQADWDTSGGQGKDGGGGWECGDRRQELVFIGLGLVGTAAGDAFVRALDACLLTDDEFHTGCVKNVCFSQWRGLQDPFPLFVAPDEEEGSRE